MSSDENTPPATPWNFLPAGRTEAVKNMLRTLFDSQVERGYLKNRYAMRPKDGVVFMPRREEILDFLLDPKGLTALYGEKSREAAHAILDAWLDGGTESALIKALKLRTTKP